MSNNNIQDSYELLREFPGLEVGDTVSPNSYGIPVHSGQLNNGYPFFYSKDGSCLNSFIPASVVRNNPDWFRKVVKKEWEIVAYNFTKYNTIVPVEAFGVHSSPNDKYYTIHSVKRLSDGITFSVGEMTGHGVIESIKIEENVGMVFYIKNPSILYLFPMYIHEFIKTPVPKKTEQHKEPDTFVWTDELKKEFWECAPLYDIDSLGELVKLFKASKQNPTPKEQLPKYSSEMSNKSMEGVRNQIGQDEQLPKIEVLMSTTGQVDCKNGMYSTMILSSKLISGDKLSEIQQSVKNILNT